MSSPYGTFQHQKSYQHLNIRRHIELFTFISVNCLFLGIICISFRGENNYNALNTTLQIKTSKHLKDIFLSTPREENILKYLQRYSSIPHSAGTHQDYKTALYTKKKLEEFGIPAKIQTYYTLLSRPVSRRVAIISPSSLQQQLNLTETEIPGDSCTSSKLALPPFIAYSPSGNVTAEVIYANYGSQQDFLLLEQMNISIRGKIAIVRYGTNFRGLKVMLAQKYGAVGVLIYSDPSDDGFGRGKVYPDGPWRPSTSVQRGSGQFISLYAGDPLTPGYPSTKHANRLSIENATNLPRIPVQPLSYGDAYYILRGLRGRQAPESWIGGLNITYNIGSGEGNVIVNLDLIIENKVGSIWNVLGEVEGSIEKDRYVIIGNHRDAWVCGAVDPNSGSAALLEVARGIGRLLSVGWKPRRTILIGSWDGEEYGLLGSTEWAEDNAKQLYNKAVAYLNVDDLVGDQAFGEGSPAMMDLLMKIAKQVPMIESNQSLYDVWMEQYEKRLASPLSSSRKLPGTVPPEFPVNILGSGTDYTPFYQHLGILSTNIGFNKSTYGVYHSSMDTVMWTRKYGDPGFKSHLTISRWWGLLTLEIADSSILPFDFRKYTLVLHRYINEFDEELRSMGMELDFSRLRASCDAFLVSAELFHMRIEMSNNPSNSMIRQINNKLMYAERQFLSSEGLPHRPWYKHILFGPGYYFGYGATAFPGIADAIALRDNAEKIEAQIEEAVKHIMKASIYLSKPLFD